MSDCQIISEMIPEYIGRSTTAKQNAEITRHISACLTCGADFALWLSVERSLKQAEKNAPSINFQAIFDKIPNDETELEKIIKSRSYSMAFDIIRYVFGTIKTANRLANLLN